MSKKYHRFYDGLLSVQENWLNKMAKKGYRLVRTGKLLYEFEECAPGQFEYRIEFIGHKSKEDVIDYCNFLEDLGYKVFFKNINLNYSIGKLRYRPWAEKGGRIATNSTTFDRELLIVEKKNDGKEFELHTSYEDKLKYCKSLRNAWLWFFLLFAILGYVQRSIVWGIGGLLVLIPIIAYQSEIIKIRHNAKIREW
ncbi:DUF2812 domain-containing protein [Thermoanaerobacterium butyriciformans]|uniref:DUF2812 domain-containing protein n=1 Tax=Thermoanaerobacterium butyriciformans TaxID=1702242 RepID=A0ABS4NF45_9THEO|nr:DUF2812 domain-containing protein [Thermoanaerobacterium butyriciformans]MBP2072286.1 hypothetical protein [Thermoanaerobacterium butyriciformans]